MTVSVAVFFGGPDDGASKVLLDEDFARGYVDTMDSLGNVVRHSIVKLERHKPVGDLIAGYELRPTEGVW